MNTISVSTTSTSRAAYRVVPDPDDPIILQLDGKLSRVLDISASGFSCPEGEVKQGRRYRFKMDLPTKTTELTGYVDVLPGADNGYLHCQFVELNADELDVLHLYVLARQKEAIRSLRSGSSHRR
ncbi:MAG: PilZ domain-containing protein [Granulosicoccus sp.]|nr:PilZ domain-containing protein [Granulosicoccus sp.]